MQDITCFRTVLLWNLRLVPTLIAVGVQHKSQQIRTPEKFLFNNKKCFCKQKQKRINYFC